MKLYSLSVLSILACFTLGTATLQLTNNKLEGNDMKQATFGAGCFWCVEAVFLRLNGVEKVVSGYTGGTVKNPTYREVTSGKTGHAEATQVTYDPSVITYEELLNVFWKTHDPTTLNRQGADVGTQYRSAVFYHDEEQRKLAQHFKDKLNEEGVFDKPIVTEITPLDIFYRAEDYHQNYFENNKEQAYCQLVIVPKLEKMERIFQDKLKTSQ
ncbi:MAG: peptide-methionine (S)-S-oxide reductase MsrA [Balneolales bacterium]